MKQSFFCTFLEMKLQDKYMIAWKENRHNLRREVEKPFDVATTGFRLSGVSEKPLNVRRHCFSSFPESLLLSTVGAADLSPHTSLAPSYLSSSSSHLWHQVYLRKPL